MGDPGGELTDGRQLPAFIILLFQLLEFGNLPADHDIPVRRTLEGTGSDEEILPAAVPGGHFHFKGLENAFFYFLPFFQEKLFMRRGVLGKMLPFDLRRLHAVMAPVATGEGDDALAVQFEKGVRRAFQDRLHVVVQPLDLLAEPDVLLQFVLQGFGVFLEVHGHLLFPCDVLQGLDGGDDLPPVVANRCGKEIEVPIPAADVRVKIPGFVSTLDDRRFLDVFLSVVLFQTLYIVIDDEVGDYRAFFRIKGDVLAVRPDEILALVTAQFGKGPIPEHDIVIFADYKHGDGRSLDDTLDGLAQGDVLFQLLPDILGVFLEAELHDPFPGYILKGLDGGDDLPLLVVDGGGKEIEMAALPSQIDVKIPSLVSPFHLHGFTDPFGTVEPLQ